MKEILSACGLDCYSCECYLATQNQNSESKADIALRWSQRYEAKLEASDINCDGCMSTGEHFNWCNHCPIRACVSSKGYKSCAECDTFPCQTNEFLYNAVPEAKATIEALR